ncbi:hypothetical protein BANRA_05405 [Escherichia coli]|nr:hypothetical protein BANRA_05405 [Escherichia coli]
MGAEALLWPYSIFAEYPIVFITSQLFLREPQKNVGALCNSSP